MDLTFIMVPFFTGLAAFSLAVFNNVEAVNIEAISVPPAVTSKTGFTDAIVVTRLAHRMQEIEKEAQSRADAKEVMAHDDGGSAAVLGEYFGLSAMLKVVQTSFGLIPYSFSGEIVLHDKKLEMILRGHDNAHHESFIHQVAAEDDLLGLINKTAYEAVRVIDPSVLAAYQFKHDYLTRDFTATENVIRRGLASEDARTHKWLLNLWGIVRYQQADRDGAIEKFRQALELDPKFASARFNWGVALARQGMLEEAIKRFKEVVQTWRSGDQLDTLAAAYTEWGFSLALQGRTEEAFAKFRTAAATDPTFSDVYTSWAEVLSAAGRSDEAQKMTDRSLQLARVEKVYTDNLVGRVQSLPAVATAH
jgi:tetratricopeptide (TPR) repeat protein